jgi:hypothetical protein
MLTLYKWYESILAGRDSTFQGIMPLQLKDPPSQLDAAIDHIMSRLHLMPRLIRLLRLYSSEPSLVLKSEIGILLQDITTPVDVEFYTSYILNSADIIPSTASHRYSGSSLFPPVDHIFHFPTTQVFSLAFHLYTYQILLSGIVSYASEGPLNIPLPRGSKQNSPVITAEHLTSQELEAATNLARCVPYAFISGKNDSGVPFAALRLVWPLELAWGSWDRLLERLHCDQGYYCDDIAAGLDGSFAYPDPTMCSFASTSTSSSSSSSSFLSSPSPPATLPFDEPLDSLATCPLTKLYLPSLFPADPQTTTLAPSAASAAAIIPIGTTLPPQHPTAPIQTTRARALQMKAYCVSVATRGRKLWHGEPVCEDELGRLRRIFEGRPWATS